MSSFNLGLAQRKVWNGIWIRVNSPFNEDLIAKINKTGFKRFHERIQHIEIVEDDGNMIGIQIWCASFFDFIRKKQRHNVFFMRVMPDLNWSCEGDLGRGLESDFENK